VFRLPPPIPGKPGGGYPQEWHSAQTTIKRNYVAHMERKRARAPVMQEVILCVWGGTSPAASSGGGTCVTSSLALSSRFDVSAQRGNARGHVVLGRRIGGHSSTSCSVPPSLRLSSPLALGCVLHVSVLRTAGPGCVSSRRSVAGGAQG
jgi:hypothetical protein